MSDRPAIKNARADTETDADNRARAGFVANVGHQIRTPLTAIIGFAELLRSRKLAADPDLPILQQILDSASGLMNTLNNLVQVLEIQRQKESLAHQPFELLALLRQLKSKYQPAAQAKRIALRIEMQGKLAPRYRGDAEKLQATLSHLLDNALHFTARGEVNIRVTGSRGSGADSHSVGFVIQDTGCGIDPELQQRILEPFEQARVGSESGGGSGLGLFIARQLVGLMGGRFALESQPDNGTTVRISVPLEALGDAMEKTLDNTELETRLVCRRRHVGGERPVVPDPWRARLGQLTRRGDEDAIRQLLMEFERIAPDAARALETLLDRFDYGGIERWLSDHPEATADTTQSPVC